MTVKVSHLTSAHPSNDTRIFRKECKSLQQSGYSVSMIAQNIQDEVVEGITIYAIPSPSNRKQRMTKTTQLIYKRAIEIDADIYHFHDPELIKVALQLKKQKKIVIYDVHEDLPRQILSMEWLPKPTRAILCRAAEIVENYAAHKFDAIICATPYITKRFNTINDRVVNINNYPILQELFTPELDWSQKGNYICYIGAIDKLRGIYEMVEAVGKTDLKLLLGGEFASEVERKKVGNNFGWHNVIELGQINRNQVKDVFKQSLAGLVLFHPAPNHINAQPNKMFEYMSTGIPVIASDFAIWKEIIEGNKCGMCVNPFDTQSIADAITWIVDHPSESEQMGKNGRTAIENIYNWENEAMKLIQLYDSLKNELSISRQCEK